MADKSELTSWVEQMASEYSFDPDAVPIGLILDLARDAAHGIARPAAPLTTYLAGVLVGLGLQNGQAAEGVATEVLQQISDYVNAEVARRSDGLENSGS